MGITYQHPHTGRSVVKQGSASFQLMLPPVLLAFKTIRLSYQWPNTAVNRDAQTAGFASCLAARYLQR